MYKRRGGKHPPFLDRDECRLGGPQDQIERCDEENVFALPGIELRLSIPWLVIFADRPI